MKDIFLLILLLITCINSSSSQELKLDLTPNETYYQNNITKVKISSEVQGEMVESNVTYGGRMRYKVIEKSDSLYFLEVQFETLNFLMENNGIEVSVNSTEVDSTNTFALIFNQMTKSPFKISMTPYGEVKNVDMDNLFDNLFEIFPEIPQLEKARILYVLQQSFGEKAMKGAIETLTAIYPKKPVSEGDVWQNKIRLETISSYTMFNTFELAKRNEDLAVLNGTSKTISDDDLSFIKVNGELMRMISTGSMESTYKVDSKTGWIIEAEIIQNISGTTERKWREDSILVLRNPFIYEGFIKIGAN